MIPGKIKKIKVKKIRARKRLKTMILTPNKPLVDKNSPKSIICQKIEKIEKSKSPSPPPSLHPLLPLRNPKNKKVVPEPARKWGLQDGRDNVEKDGLGVQI